MTALDDCCGKRDFAATLEPGADVESSPHNNLSVIQRHAARRLHYDLRLELGGALKSWAVPKGSSPDTAVKHLAVHMEDYPLDYAGFEGVIPQGEYDGGTVMIWDRGVWHPEGETAADPEASYRKGKLRFRLEGEKLRGGWTLVRLKRRRDEPSTRRLFFKQRDGEVREGLAADTTRRKPRSVKSGRSMAGIAAEAGGGSRKEDARPGDQPRETLARFTIGRAGRRRRPCSGH